MTDWQRLFRYLKAPKLKRWYKRLVCKRNRRKARLNPESKDKKLNPRDID
jgi:hypothetical protein